MATLRLKYVHSFVDKTGTVRFYFRHRGKRWPLPGEPGSAEFTAAYDALRRECLSARKADSSNVAFGPHVIEQYLGHDIFGKKAPGTQKLYRKTLDHLRDICGSALIGDLQERHCRQIRQKFTATSKADLAMTMLRILWTFAKEELAMDLGPNPTGEIQKRHQQGWSHEPWPEWVIEKFEAEGEPKPNAQLALMLLHYTGQRVSDVVRMRWSDYGGERIKVRQLKTGTPLLIRCHSRLKAAPDRAERRSEFILTTRYGKGYQAHGLCGMIRMEAARIGAPECSAHGSRCNAATALGEAECSVHEIMSITGHQTFKEAQRYTASVNQKKLADRAVAKWEKVANPRTTRQQVSG
jgi:integrase